jgi:hypothetical protein
MEDRQETNPVIAKWREVASELASVKRKLGSLQEKHDELAKKESMLRGALEESGVSLPVIEEISPKRRRVTTRNRVEDLVLQVTEEGEELKAEDVLDRLRSRGIATPWKYAAASVRNAMRRSDSFQTVRRGIFKRVSVEDSNEEAPPPEGNGASAHF